MPEEIDPQKSFDAARRLLDEAPPDQERQSVELHKGQRVSVPKTITGLAGTLGGEDIASIRLGGATASEGSFEPEDFVIISVHNREDADYKTLAGMAQRERGRASDIILAALNPGGGFAGAAFLEPGRFYTLGREGNIKWYTYGAVVSHPDDWTPFEKNLSVSRRQLFIQNSDVDNTVGLLSITENSRTQVFSPRFAGPVK